VGVIPHANTFASAVAVASINAAKGVDSSPSSDATPSSYAAESSNAAPGDDFGPDGHTEHGVDWLSSPHMCSSRDGASEQQPGGWYPHYREWEPERSPI
jgi:hypothetical protein